MRYALVFACLALFCASVLAEEDDDFYDIETFLGQLNEQAPAPNVELFAALSGIDEDEPNADFTAEEQQYIIDLIGVAVPFWPNSKGWTTSAAPTVVSIQRKPEVDDKIHIVGDYGNGRICNLTMDASYDKLVDECLDLTYEVRHEYINLNREKIKVDDTTWNGIKHRGVRAFEIAQSDSHFKNMRFLSIQSLINLDQPNKEKIFSLAVFAGEPKIKASHCSLVWLERDSVPIKFKLACSNTNYGQIFDIPAE